MTCYFEQSTAKWLANLTVYRLPSTVKTNFFKLTWITRTPSVVNYVHMKCLICFSFRAISHSKSSCTCRIKIRRSTVTIRRMLKTWLLPSLTYKLLRSLIVSQNIPFVSRDEKMQTKYS